MMGRCQTCMMQDHEAGTRMVGARILDAGQLLQGDMISDVGKSKMERRALQLPLKLEAGPPAVTPLVHSPENLPSRQVAGRPDWSSPKTLPHTVSPGRHP